MNYIELIKYLAKNKDKISILTINKSLNIFGETGIKLEYLIEYLVKYGNHPAIIEDKHIKTISSMVNLDIQK